MAGTAAMLSSRPAGRNPRESPGGRRPAAKAHAASRAVGGDLLEPGRDARPDNGRPGRLGEAGRRTGRTWEREPDGCRPGMGDVPVDAAGSAAGRVGAGEDVGM